jgi:PAS domain S-box-containing protein
MTSSSFGSDDLALEVLWQDGERVFCRTWRLGADGRQEFMAVRSAAERPTPDTVARLTREYELKDYIDSEWAVRPLELVHKRGQTVLVLESPGGRPLDRLVDPAMDVGKFLRLAINLSVALGRLHERGLIHKDIKPANILVSPVADRVWLTGFGIALRLARERQSPAPPELIAGTLAYMAPEQTGRMNRSIDSRSDLYALGVTFYEMLTGVLPFAASDPMEWIHCHIARQPASPTDRVPGVPPAISAIVMKLLAKATEDRYQTAGGLEHDLRRCLADWEGMQWIDPFPLGEHDIPGQLFIPEKLYGRERETETLLAAFDSVVANGVPELVLVCGYSGIGKSAVVNELHKVLVLPRGLFASGKFDQYKREIPYATLAQAFQNLIRQLLRHSEAEIAKWRHNLLEALGPNGLLIADLVPELKLIIGEQPAVPELLPQEAKRRFHLVFRRFIGVFARPEHPLALFIDDLQWLDAATLDLIESLLTARDIRHLLLIGAYRDNEVSPTHALMRKLEAIREAGGKTRHIVLAPLGKDDLTRLVADTLHCVAERADPLAQLILAKTAGNPFFAIQFISALLDEGLLTFDHAGAQWRWDLSRIEAKRYTDNVADLMAHKLRRLPITTNHVLRQLAFLGNSAQVRFLSIVQQESEDKVHADLREALRAELVVRSDTSYRFVHDRIQEAVYSSIPQELRAGIHLGIGRLLAANIRPDQREEAIFDIVGQFDRSTGLITSREEREQVAEFYLIAGKRAKAAAAYASALRYLVCGSALLTGDCSECKHDLIFPLELHRSECEFLTGELEMAEVRLAGLAGRAAGVVDLAIVTRLRMEIFTTLDRSDRTIEVGLDFLGQVGIVWKAHPTPEEVRQEYERMWRQIGDRPIETLLDSPRMADPAARAIMDVLAELQPAALSTDQSLYHLVVGRMVNISLERGNSDASCLAYAYLAMVLGPQFRDYKAAFRFGKLAVSLVENRGLTRFMARTHHCIGAHVNHWTQHVRMGRPRLQHAFEAANRIGDVIFAAYSRTCFITNLLASGDPLEEVQREAEEGLEFAERARFGLVTDIISAQLALIRTLRGVTGTFGYLTDARFDELQVERRLSSHPGLAIAACWYWIRKLQARFFAGDYVAATGASANAQRLLWTSRSFLESAEAHFYGALSHAASCDAALPAQHRQHFEALTAHHKQLVEWAENCPENFENRAALVGAEIARIEGRELEAMRLYERAIHSARANGFVNNEALANERAAGFYAARGFETIAKAYLREARACYLRWGADGKVRQLYETYPHLREETQPGGPRSTIGAPFEHLDLSTVINVSQAVSSEIVLGKLLDTLMRTAIEQAGAERGLLMLPRGADLRIAAEARTAGDAVGVQLRDETVTAAVLPESVLHYALRTKDIVILEDASAQNPFFADPYICHHQARSILCVPLINQAKLIGMLYLENNLTSRAFVPARIAVLRLLASQAAISLENARLYRDLEEREAKIRRLVDANIIGIFIWDFEGQILEANEAFLNMIGHDHEDLVAGRIRWTDLTPPEWRDLDTRLIQEDKVAGALQPFEKEYLRQDGSRVPLLIGVATFQEGGNQGVAFVLDLTGRKGAEEALRRSEANLAEAQRLSHMGSWVFNPATTEILYVSEECYRIWGFDPAQGLPNRETVWRKIHPGDRGRVLDEAAEALHQKRDCSIDFRIVLPDGTIKHVEAIGHPVFSASGSLVEVIGTHIDVTERKRAQEQRERLRELESDLAHMNRLGIVGEQAASLSHEIMQPIATARNNARAAMNFLDRQPPELGEVREALACVVADTDRAGEIVDRIRDHIRKAPPRKSRFDLNAAIDEVIVLGQSAITKNAVLVQTRLAEGLFPVQGDRVQLQQVILNLVLNAVEALSAVEEGPREVLISTERTQGNGVLVAVRDSGPGIDPEHVERVFEAFYTTKPSGLGMGLSICRTIIGAHGGRLWADANEPRGAVFQFTLPGAGERS